MARRRPRRTAASTSRMRVPGSPEVMTILLLAAILVFVLVFKGRMAESFSNLMGSFSGPAPQIAPSTGGGGNQSP